MGTIIQGRKLSRHMESSSPSTRLHKSCFHVPDHRHQPVSTRALQTSKEKRDHKIDV